MAETNTTAENMIAYYEQQIAKLKAQSATTDAEIAAKKQAMAELDGKIAALRATLPDSIFDNDPLADNPGYTNKLSGGGAEIYNATANKVLTGTAYADSITNQDGGDYVTINSGAGNDTIANKNGGHVLINAGDGNDSIISSYSYNTIQAARAMTQSAWNLPLGMI